MSKKTTALIDSIKESLKKNLPITEGEGFKLEFKRTKNGQLPVGEFWETFSAFSNSSGGVILLGVEDSGKLLPMTESEAKKCKNSIVTGSNDKAQISENLLQDGDIQALKIPAKSDSKIILAVTVRAAPLEKKPIFTGRDPLKGTRRRINESDLLCSEDEVRQMFADSSIGDHSEDDKILEGFGLEQLDGESLRQYRQLLSSRNPNHPWLTDDQEDFLIKLRAWRKDLKNSKSGLTLAGLLMFGKDEWIKNAVPFYELDYFDKSNPAQTRWKRRITTDGTWTANLFQFALKITNLLKDSIEMPFELEGGLFRKEENKGHVAVREAVINTIIHADYGKKGGVVIERYMDRLIFSNPGNLLVPKEILENEAKAKRSICRNSALRDMFFLCGLADKAGTGVDKIYAGWREQKWQKPIIEELVKPQRVTWILPMTSVVSKESFEKIKQAIGEFALSELSDLELRILDQAVWKEWISHDSIKKITSTHRTDITKTLTGLAKRGYLISDGGKTRSTHYRLPESTYSPNEPISSPNEPISSLNEPISSLNDLLQIAALALEKKRIDPKSMREIIQKLCENRWLTVKEIASLINRKPSSLYNSRVLTTMVRDKILHLRYPDQPNHRDQAYGATKNFGKL
jgi:ATP-dependent DNA helicase RecG